jgi:uncharacterized protein (DUF433 family)
MRPNPSLKLSPNGVAHWACGAGASPQFCAAVPAHHTVGATLARTLGSKNSHLLPPRRRLTPHVDKEHSMKSPRVISDPEIMGGTPVFVGTRVPVRILFEHLEAGDPLEIFLEDFPSVTRDLAVQVLEDAKASLVADAHTA